VNAFLIFIISILAILFLTALFRAAANAKKKKPTATKKEEGGDTTSENTLPTRVIAQENADVRSKFPPISGKFGGIE